MAVLSITGSPAVLGQLPGAVDDVPLTVLDAGALDNGDGTWTVTGETDEANIPALTELGCAVTIEVSDDDELTQWQAIDDQVDRGPGLA
jgi:hypothetical protein